MKTTLTLLLATILVFGVAVDQTQAQVKSAKGGPDPEKQAQGKAKKAKTRQAGGSGDAGDVSDLGGNAVGAVDAAEAGDGGDPEARREREAFEGPRSGSAQFFTALASLRPRRLAPGESGTLHVVVILRKDRVVLPDKHILLHVEQENCPLILGAQQRKPARVAEYSKRYQGQKIYDDSIEFEIPVTVAGTAKPQKYLLRGRVELDVTAASTGKSLGRITGGLNGAVKIGKPLPRPTISKVNKASGASGESQAAVAVDPKTTGGSGVAVKDPGNTSGARKGQASTPAEEERRGELDRSEPAPGDPPAESAFGDPIVLIGGGLVLLLVLVLLVRKGRR